MKNIHFLCRNKYTIIMKLSNKAIDILKNDLDLRMDFARAIGITESSLKQAISRNSKKPLMNYAGIGLELI